MRKPILLSWSGGKDSAWALHLLQQSAEYEPVGLLTTVNRHFARVAIHGVREELLARQARAAGLPVWTVDLPWPCPNEAYQAAVSTAYGRARRQGVHGIAFGDLFLEDIRAFREASLEGTGLAPIFPCWGLPTAKLAREMIASGTEARLVCVDPRQLDERFAGRWFDAALLRELPDSVDPCGERGEFHTFVSAGPMFRAGGKLQGIRVSEGEVVQRDGFCYADLLPCGPGEKGAT